ncbi:hypothetical protein AB0E96_32320 [Kitasatospora sp. NPDC036755]|uniref:hypothetical protein n=1 Tax=Kitasatospora sp. NPDC036755 TaxID=3154600 RepID=UPI0033E4A289
MMTQSGRLTVPHARSVRVVPATEAEVPQPPNLEAIERWLEAYDKSNGKAVGPQPAGLGAGQYQALVLDLEEGTLRFHCDDWRVPWEARGSHGGADAWIWYSPGLVPSRIYWQIDSGVRELPHLTADQGNALAEELAGVAQILLENLVEVPGAGEADWSPESVAAACEIHRRVQRDPDDPTRPAPMVVSMAQAVAAVPDLVEKKWADWTGAQLDEQAPELTRVFGRDPDRELIAEAMALQLGENRPLLVVGTRAWLYGYRREMASGRTPMELERWYALSGRSSLVSADDQPHDLVHLAEREQRAATEEGVLLVDVHQAMRAQRARLRAQLVRELETVLGPHRVEAKKLAKLAQIAVNARLNQILAWEDVAHSNYAELGRAAGMTRQAVQAKADALRKDDEAEDPGDPWSSVVGQQPAELKPGHADGVNWRCVACETVNALTDQTCLVCDRARPPLYAGHRRYTITCPRCGSTDVEEYGEPIPNTDDSADRARCNTCGDSWALDPGADASCTRCGGSGLPRAGAAIRKRNGRWEDVPSCERVEP